MRDLNAYVSQIQPLIRDRTNGTVEVNDIRDALNRGISFLQNKYGIHATKNRSTIDIFPSIHEYPAPSDLHDLITVFDRGTPSDYDMLTPNEFWKRLKQKNRIMSVDTITGDRFLLIKDNSLGSSTIIHNCDSLTDNGTWAADTGDSDAINLTSDGVTRKEGTASLNFDIDVSQSVNDFAAIQNSTITALDLSSQQELGTLFMWVFMPDVTNVTSVLARWGSDASNYWENSSTTSFNGQAFRTGSNRIGIPWQNATETGTVDETAIDFIYVRIVYSASQADDTDFRVDDIRMESPETRELSYYSTNFTKTSAGVLQDFFSATDDQTLLLNEDDDLLLYWALADAYRIKELPNDRQEALREFNQLLSAWKARHPSERRRQSFRYYR